MTVGMRERTSCGAYRAPDTYCGGCEVCDHMWKKYNSHCEGLAVWCESCCLIGKSPMYVIQEIP